MRLRSLLPLPVTRNRVLGFFLSFPFRQLILLVFRFPVTVTSVFLSPGILPPGKLLPSQIGGVHSLLLHFSEVELSQKTKMVISLLMKLGFIPSREKSDIIPSQVPYRSGYFPTSFGQVSPSQGSTEELI